MNDNLRHQVIDQAYTFYEALATLADSTDTDDRELITTHSQNLSHYLQSIQSLAADHGMRGLERVCAQTQLQLINLTTRTTAEQQNIYEQLEPWPSLVSRYLYSSTDDGSTYPLVSYLQDFPWVRPLNDDQAQELTELLRKEEMDGIAFSNADESDIHLYHHQTPVGSLTVELSENSQHSEDPEDEREYPLSPLHLDLSSTDFAIVDSVRSESVPALESTFSDYQTLEITKDSGLLLPDFEIAQLSAESPFENGELTFEQNDGIDEEEGFDHYQTMVNAEEISDTFNGEDHLHLSEELIGLDDEEWTDLPDLLDLPDLAESSDLIPEETLPEDRFDNFQEEVKSEDSSAPATQAKAAAPSVNQYQANLANQVKHADSLADLSNRVVELIDILATTLNQFVTVDEESDSFVEAISQYTNTVQLLWEASGKINLKGFQEVCTFINDNVFEASTVNQTKRLELRELFALWPKLLLDYLQTPTKGSSVLVEYLASPTWPLPLSKPRANSLLVQLIQDTLTPTIDELTPPTTTVLPPATPTLTHHEANSTAAVAEVTPSFPTFGEHVPPNQEDLVAAQPPFHANRYQSWEGAFIEDSVLLASEQEPAEEDLLWQPSEWQDTLTKQHLAAASASGQATTTTNEIDADLPAFKWSEGRFNSTQVSTTPPNAIQDDTDDHNMLPRKPASNFPTLEEDVLLALAESTDDEDEYFLPELFTEALKNNDHTLSSAADHTEIPAAPAVTPSLTANGINSGLQASATPPPPSLLAATDLAAPHLLDLLRIEISEAQPDLSKALAKLATAEEDSADLLEAIEDYCDNTKSIADTAKKINLVAMEEICAFVTENMFELSTYARIIRRTAHPHLEIWPRLALNYLQKPLQGAQDLVAHLRNPIWPFALDEAKAQNLLARLTRGALGTESTSPSTYLTSLISTTTPAVLAYESCEIPSSPPPKEPIPPVIQPATLSEDRVDHLQTVVHSTAPITPEVLEIVSGQLLDLTDGLTVNLHQICQADDGSEEILTGLESYNESMLVLADTAEMAQLVGLQEVFTFINEQITQLAVQDQATRMAAEEVLTAWPSLVLSYLQDPSAPALDLTTLKKLSNLDLDLTTLKKLSNLDLDLTTLKKLSNLDSSRDSTRDSTLAPPEILELVISQILEVEETLASALTTLGEAEEGSEALFSAVETYTESVQTILEVAELAKLVGVQDLCIFINDNITALAVCERTTRLAIRPVGLSWPSRLVVYLRDPQPNVIALVSLLQESVWPTPLDQVATHQLQQRLLPTTLPLTATTVPTVLALTTVEPLSNQFQLAALDILALVSGQIIDSQESMSSALEVCMSIENSNPAFLEAIENYTTQVQTILETAEMAGLVGLQEVCAFINENLIEFGLQDLPARQETHSCLQQWPNLVLEYLQSPLSGATDLVNLLQAKGWPRPLEASRAQEFLSLLTQSSIAPAQVAAHYEEVQGVKQPPATDPVEMVVEEETEAVAALEVEAPTQEISLGGAEVLGILTEELESTKDNLANELQKFTSLNNNETTFVEAAENYVDQVQRLNTAADMLGLGGLQQVCSFIIDNVQLLAKQDLAARTKAKKVLAAWPDLVLAYLNSPMDSVITMLNHLRESAWAKPLADEQAHQLLKSLTEGASGEAEIDTTPSYSRPTQAKPEDVSLHIPSDINQELLAAYLQEVPQHASDFSECVQNIIRDFQVAEVERAQRIAHTLKGSSNIIGIKGIANIAHHLEDTLEYLAQKKVVPPKALTDTMVEAADCIELMVDALVNREESPMEAQPVLQNVLDWANRIDQGNFQAPAASTRAKAVPASAPKDKTAKAAADTQDTSAEKKAEGGEAGATTPEQVLRVPTKTIDNLMRLVGELSISLGQIQVRLKHVLQSTRILTEQDLVLQRKTFALENLVDVRGITGIMSNQYHQTTADEDGFDPLEFEEYNELHSVAHSFIESIADNRELAMSIRGDLSELELMFIHQQRLNKEFEASVMITRMVPVNTILAKLQRNVRQTCRATGKKVDLEVAGTDILIDSDVLSNLADPLQHILRNSIDHGIEAPDERVLLGKPESGTIHLSFYREGNNVVVKCQDDGQGLNYTNIRYTAIQRGLLKENQEVTESELARLILMSGFSTKSGVTQVSGRGVGMDVVHTNIRQMKGILDLMSQTGKGMTIVIKLPMTLVTVHVLLVRVGPRVLGIPTNNLEQVLAPGVGEYQRVGDEISFKMGKNFYVVRALGLLLNLPADRGEVEEDDPRPVVLVHEETGVTAVLVDELIDTHDLVMKSMGQFVKNIHGVAGAAVLGDGSVIALLDLPELLRSPMQATLTASLATDQAVSASIGVQPPSGVPTILIVDDSLSVRKSLSLLIEDAGFETLLAKDGLEAIEVMNQKRPHVMLVDMEMPRMNGLELTAHVRSSQSTQNMPIFMITSRTTEKHREQAKAAGVNAYLTKPYQDTELLGLIDKALAGR